jgi:N-ethylmaleimide reductase
VGSFNFTQERADWVLEKGFADLVALGRLFIANPDLPKRLYAGWPLNELRLNHLFGGDAEGYIDYPRYDDCSCTIDREN